MTTNGILLEQHASNLKKAGLTRVNISLDTMDPVKYRDITGGGSLSAMGKGYHLLEPELVLSPELSADEIIAKVDTLF